MSSLEIKPGPQGWYRDANDAWILCKKGAFKAGLSPKYKYRLTKIEGLDFLKKNQPTEVEWVAVVSRFHVEELGSEECKKAWQDIWPGEKPGILYDYLDYVYLIESKESKFYVDDITPEFNSFLLDIDNENDDDFEDFEVHLQVERLEEFADV